MASDPVLTYTDVAILYRTNAQSRALEDAFRRRGIPYQIVGGVRFYERREIQDILAYLRLISNPLNTVAFERVVNYPRRGIGKVTIERLVRWAQVEGVSLLEAGARAKEISEIPAGGVRGLTLFSLLIQRYSALASQMQVGELLESLVEELRLFRHLQEEGPDGRDRAENVGELIAAAHEYNVDLMEGLGDDMLDHFTELDLFLQQVALVADVDRHDPNAKAVTLMTLHNAKGLEFPVVFISGLENGLFPLFRAYDTPEELEEERRLCYVGVTRSKKKLFLTYCQRRRFFGSDSDEVGQPSCFLGEIPSHLTRVSGSEVENTSPSYDYSSESSDPPFFEEDSSGSQSPDSWGEGSSTEAFDGRFIRGARIEHPKYGRGRVLQVQPAGDDIKVTVKFPGLGIKKMLQSYARLRLV